MGLQKSGTTDNFAFFYQNKDHLGTVRETVTSTGAMKQRVNYYPFGDQLVDTLKAMVLSPNFQQYKYNGKEFDGMYGLNTYDYGARHYPVLARWDRIDPLCEKYYGVSPYAYCENGPVNAIDPDGRNGLKVSIKAGWKIAKTVAKNGVKSLAKGATYAEAFNDVVEDAKTVFDSNASTKDRFIAGASLASEIFSPVSIRDGKAAIKGVKTAVDHTSKQTSRAASRKVMRDQGIPTSQQPKSQSRNASGREYTYETPDSYGTTDTKSVQQQTMDRSHDKPHWEAGSVKTNDNTGEPRRNRNGRPKLDNTKSKEEYE